MQETKVVIHAIRKATRLAQIGMLKLILLRQIIHIVTSCRRSLPISFMERFRSLAQLAIVLIKYNSVR